MKKPKFDTLKESIEQYEKGLQYNLYDIGKRQLEMLSQFLEVNCTT